MLKVMLIFFNQSVDFSEAQEGDPKYLAPELMQGKFGKPADVFRYEIMYIRSTSLTVVLVNVDLTHIYLH